MARSNPIFEISPDMPRLVELQISKIQPNPHQPRKTMSEAEIESLAESIRRVGLLSPIVVVKTEDTEIYILAAGQRRLKAYERIKRDTIPAIIATTGDPLELAMIENLQRVDPHPMEMADTFARMIAQYDYTHVQIAEIVSKPRSTVTEWLLLNDLPEDIKMGCRALDIPPAKTLLVALARLTDKEEQQALWEDIKAGKKITTRDAQRRQREGATSLPADVPKELKPVQRAIDTSHRIHDTLKKIKPATLAGHSDKLEELKALHQQIGRMIARLAKDSQRATEATDVKQESEAAQT